jgi:outer membrane protein OmpA-like peptidoglycan-associated protein
MYKVLNEKNKDLQLMNWGLENNPEARPGTRFARAASALTIVLLIAGCSAVPDWANPIEWYDSAADLISGDQKTRSEPGAKNTVSALASKVAGQQKGFPNLAGVPERPKVASLKERKRLGDRLKADRKNAVYSSEVIKRQRPATMSPPQTPTMHPAATTTARQKPPSPPLTDDRTTELTAPVPVAAPITQVLPPLPGSSSILSRQPISRLPKFDPPPSSPSVLAAASQFSRPQMGRPSPSTRSVARVGNPIFGVPPADLAASVGAVRRSAPNAVFAQPRVAGTFPTNAALPVGTEKTVIRFKAGSARLNRNERRLIKEVAVEYRNRGGAIRVEGHASSRTRDMDQVQHRLVNFKVSLDRANVVAAELVRQGVPARSVFVAAMSDSQPIFTEVMPAGDRANQRVEIRFVN